MSNRTTNIVRFQSGTFEYLYDDYASLEVTGRVPLRSGDRSAISGGKRSFPDSGKSQGRLPLERLGRCHGDDVRPGVGQRALHRALHWRRGGSCRGSNVFVQLRALNRGWSEEGKHFREMEAYCEANPGTFCFNRPIYDDQTARPAFFEFGLVKREGRLWVECFSNR